MRADDVRSRGAGAGTRPRIARASAALALAWGIAARAFPAAATETSVLLEPVAGPARAIAEYAWLVLGICGAIFVVVASLIVISAVRFRARPDDDGREPPQVYGSNQIELAWTVVPVLIVVVLGLVTARTILALQKDEMPEGWLEVDAVGHQWWWEFHYPEYGFSTANELHLPLSDPRAPTPSFLNLQSQDVIHSFWVPRLAGKTDLIPNRTNHLWIDPHVAGTYLGQCAEYCGTEHAKMLLRVVVQTPEDFARWVAEQQRPARSDAAGRAGRALFERTACINCHTVRGTPADGRFGPDLTHLMSRETLGSGIAPNRRANLVDWITDPDHLKPGARMPAMQLAPEQIEQIADYLVTLR